MKPSDAIGRFDNFNHWMLPADPKRNCRHCVLFYKKRNPKAGYQCSKCDVGLHTGCFVEYHDKELYKAEGLLDNKHS